VQYGDAYWAELAQSYPAYVPEPGLGAAHGPEDNIVLGRWGEVLDWPVIATGAANLPDGRIVAWASTSVDFFEVGDEFTYGTIYDPTNDSFVDANNTVHDTFCAGVSMLADGSIFAAGGGDTITTTSLFSGGEWSLSDDLEIPRWYPSSTTLASGQVLVTLGTELSGASELWTPSAGYESAYKVDLNNVLADESSLEGMASWYPALNVSPDGTLIHPGPINQLFSLDLQADVPMTHFGDLENVDTHRLYNSTVMYDVGKLLLAGGGSPPVNTAMTIDVSAGSPIVLPTNPMNSSRTFQNSVVLPNGDQ